MSAVPENARALERLLVRIRELRARLLDMDMYERWGGGHDASMNEQMAHGGETAAAHARSQAELGALVERLRLDDPAAIAYWADAHERLLARFLETSTDATARFVAEGERKGWRAFAEGKGPFVEENVFYVHPEAALHRELFGDLG